MFLRIASAFSSSPALLWSSTICCANFLTSSRCVFCKASLPSSTSAVPASAIFVTNAASAAAPAPPPADGCCARDATAIVIIITITIAVFMCLVLHPEQNRKARAARRLSKGEAASGLLCVVEETSRCPIATARVRGV